ncbi:hypothetical protein QN360_12245 [Glaciimonas sp. CA11.2]|uniref:hypothetical protein n=1 Tax=unclassified Glaciimonas TaxID=2644401 RepID=UPI002AB47CC9|nr:MULTISPECIES: hypothetical protein [unclassified Glaciimonas]MDY7548824.1 hypothetical protein [Glaciimonas sp. CA11.2]MEB0012470.1 hypothetical protein [Glaciimonas sp. Cout2]MEB0082601.1 hypothetical protein [Glaciimonas sp. Gout2]MEB0163674.1 hypothetical protein [Glaciimonas sp. CA11.2]
MTQFAKWCISTKESVNGHEMTVLDAEPKRVNAAVKALAKLSPRNTRQAHVSPT